MGQKAHPVPYDISISSFQRKDTTEKILYQDTLPSFFRVPILIIQNTSSMSMYQYILVFIFSARFQIYIEACSNPEVTRGSHRLMFVNNTSHLMLDALIDLTYSHNWP